MGEVEGPVIPEWGNLRAPSYVQAFHEATDDAFPRCKLVLDRSDACFRRCAIERANL
jgi:hypothetical protein